MRDGEIPRNLHLRPNGPGDDRTHRHERSLAKNSHGGCDRSIDAEPCIGIDDSAPADYRTRNDEGAGADAHSVRNVNKIVDARFLFDDRGDVS